MTSSMTRHPGETAFVSGGSALWFGLLGAGAGYVVNHHTIGAVAGATLGAFVGAGMAHLFEDANFFGSTPPPEADAIKSNITKVSVASAVGAVAAGVVGAKVVPKHPATAAVIAAGVGSALAAGVADSILGTPPTGQIGTGDWRPAGVFS